MAWSFSRSVSTVLGGETRESSPFPHTRFAFRLFREVSRTNDSPNLFYSPSSVMLCLALVYELASGETRQSMATALEIAALDRAGIETEVANLKSAFKPQADTATALANAIFLGRHARIDAAVKARLSALYDAELSGLDFSSPEAVATINEWVSTKTKGKIPRIVSQLSSLTALVALNAVYFKSRWRDPFRKERTRDQAFRTVTGRSKQIPMMIQGGRYRYHEDRHVQIASLPYCGNVAMYIALPRADADMTRFRQSLTSGVWESWISKLRIEPGDIQLPRFRVDYEAELSGALKVLGMSRAFDANRAEFGHVQTDLPPIWLDRVVHRAVTEVNEQGTEAAAATIAYVVATAALHQKPPKVFNLIVDHPFLTVIRDETTKTILFMGWIGDPQ